MPVARLKIKPEPAEEYPACNEESQLELYLQRQLEEDVARIFDESIYSDLEVVCGKLKVLTHSCILKARTHKFYHKLQAILHVNIGRNTFDEIYSFISDAYTECNIKHQENEIIKYLENNLDTAETANYGKTKLELEEPEVFLTPKCVSPYVEKSFPKAIISSPSTELTKEYYALVPIERNLLDKELIEQDALSDAFQSIIKAQSEDQSKFSQRNKPTSLSLTSSHSSKIVVHSNSCDILYKNCHKVSISPKRENSKIVHTNTSQDTKSNQTAKSTNDSNGIKTLNNCDLSTDKGLDPAFSPDSLITDEPSSCSDYLSAAYTCSPGVSSFGQAPQLNVGINTTKMENIFTLSDSGLENTAMLGSISSHKDVTLTDISLSESTLHDLVTDDASNSVRSIPSPLGDKNHFERSKQSGTSSDRDCNGRNPNKNVAKEISGKSSKEEKQRQNEEIVILESSSLSSETGSWESVYPPRFAEKDVCEKFISYERQYCIQETQQRSTVQSPIQQSDRTSAAVNKSSIKSTACFIDAASLADENDEVLNVQSSKHAKLDVLPTPSQPVPCSTNKLDISPNDWSEGNENEDSLEQADKKDPDSIQKDLSPTIFEMTPITEDSLCTNAFESATQVEQVVEIEKISNAGEALHYTLDKERSLTTSTLFMSTPNNSIMSLKTFKQCEEDKSIDAITEECLSKQVKGINSPPIMSGGLSVEDHLLQIGSSRESSPFPVAASAWVVDMSAGPKTEVHKDCSKNSEAGVEKKNIFSMYIDLGEKSTLKDMPARLSSSMQSKKNASNSEKMYSQSQNNTQIFEKYESLCNDPSISISEIIAIPEKHVKAANDSEDSGVEISKGEAQPNNNKPAKKQASSDRLTALTATAIWEETTDLQSSDLFVKLSDLDKPVQKSDITITKEGKEMDVRMTRSIPENNWSEQPISTNSRSIEVISSFHSENALSLNRLFPHLKNEFSRSMPGSLSSRTRSPLRLGTASTIGDADEQASDMSEVSSMQSSICRSGFGNSTTDSQTSSLIDNCTSRLGQDLLRMFLEEIAPDVIVEVSGKRFKAHKCILSSRCQYFAGILSGGWVESLGNVIVLPPFSYNVVYFALCHIYSGLATIPDSVSIVELATIADMLGLEGLKEAIMFTLKAKYCHHFHKPCAVCIVGVLECFPLSSVYGLDDLYHKCLKWITKHFSKVWPTKSFATLPTDLLDKCYQQHIVNFTVDNVVDTVYGCGITVGSLQNSRWAESVARMCRRLINAAAHFTSPRLLAVLQAVTPLPAEAPIAAKQALEDCIAAAIEWAPPDEACLAYHYLSTLIKDIRNQIYFTSGTITSDENNKTPVSSNIPYAQVASWRLQCESALVRATPRVVVTHAFKELPSALRRRLRELGCISYDTQASPCVEVGLVHDKKRAPYPVHTKNNKSPNPATTRSVDIAHVRASFVPYAPKPVIPLGAADKLRSNNDLRVFNKSSSTAPPKVRTTKAQEERAKFNKYKNTKSQDRLNTSASSRLSIFESTKPRYLEQKVNVNENRMIMKKKLFSNVESSSESSRNSSPIQVRNLKTNPPKTRLAQSDVQTTSHDSYGTGSRPRTAEPSTESLSESQKSNKYATYTKSKNPTQRSTESIKTSSNNIYTTPLSANNGNKRKTKIPVYLKQNPKPKTNNYKNIKELTQTPCVSNRRTNAICNKPAERKPAGSLMNATKSSSAKIVPKVVRESPNSKCSAKSPKSANVSKHNHDSEPSLGDIPLMERSGTFLKDEPTFGDKTTEIDIDH